MYDIDYYANKFCKSLTRQYSLPPLGRGRRIINGIDFSASSISAIMCPSIIFAGMFLTNGVEPELICPARCPIIRARSNLVKNGSVRCKSSMILPCLSRITCDSAITSVLL